MRIRQDLRVPVVETCRETQSGVHEPGAIMSESTGHWVQSRHLAQSHHHRVNDDRHDNVSQPDTDGTTSGQSSSGTDEKSLWSQLTLLIYAGARPTVPIEPPRAIIDRCRGFKVLCTCDSPGTAARQYHSRQHSSNCTHGRR